MLANALIAEFKIQIMTAQSEFEIVEGVPGTAWNRCKSFLRKRRRIVVSLTICVTTVVLFSVFVTLIFKLRYHQKDVDAPKAAKGIYKQHLYEYAEFILI